MSKCKNKRNEQKNNKDIDKYVNGKNQEINKKQKSYI